MKQFLSILIAILLMTSSAQLFVQKSQTSPGRYQNISFPISAKGSSGGVTQVWNNNVHFYRGFYAPAFPIPVTQSQEMCSPSILNETIQLLPAGYTTIETACYDYFCRGIPYFFNSSDIEEHQDMYRLCKLCDFDLTLESQTNLTCPWLYNTTICSYGNCDGISPGGICVSVMRKELSLCFIPDHNVFVAFNDYTHLYLYPFMYRWGNIVIMILEAVFLITYFFITILPEIKFQIVEVKELLKSGTGLDVLRAMFSLRSQIIVSLVCGSIVNIILLFLDLPKFTVITFMLFGYIIKLGFTYYAVGLFIIQWRHILEQADRMKGSNLSILNMVFVVGFQLVFFFYVLVLGVLLGIEGYLKVVFGRSATIVLGVWAATIAGLIAVMALIMTIISIILLIRLRLAPEAFMKSKLSWVILVFSIFSFLIVLITVLLTYADDSLSIPFLMCYPFIGQFFLLVVWSVLAFGMGDVRKINFLYKSIPIE